MNINDIPKTVIRDKYNDLGLRPFTAQLVVDSIFQDVNTKEEAEFIATFFKNLIDKKIDNLDKTLETLLKEETD